MISSVFPPKCTAHDKRDAGPKWAALLYSDCLSREEGGRKRCGIVKGTERNPKRVCQFQYAGYAASLFHIIVHHTHTRKHTNRPRRHQRVVLCASGAQRTLNGIHGNQSTGLVRDPQSVHSLCVILLSRWVTDYNSFHAAVCLQQFRVKAA